MIDYEAWRFWLGILQLVGTAAIGVYVWWSNREKVTRKRFEALERDVAERVTRKDLKETVETMNAPCAAHLMRTGKVEDRLTRTEESIRHLPTSRDLSALAGRLEGIEGTLKGLTRAVDLMNEHLINGGRR